MKTKAEFIAQCKAENPTMIQTLNGEKIVVDDAEYNAACDSWADMQIVNQTLEAEISEKAAAKAALLERLGITADEAALLLG
jgi:hypothetical protein